MRSIFVFPVLSRRVSGGSLPTVPLPNPHVAYGTFV